MIQNAIAFTLIGIFIYIVMVLTERWESVRGMIRKRSPSFLYIRDFWTNGIGDVVGLSAVTFYVGYSFKGFAPIHHIAPIIALLVVFMYQRANLMEKRVKQDHGYMKLNGIWRTTLNGRVHLIYFFYIVSVIAIGLIDIAVFGLSYELIYVGIAGLLIYAATFAMDWRKGSIKIME